MIRRCLLALWAWLPRSIQAWLGWLLHVKLSVTVCALIIAESESLLLAEHTYKKPRWAVPGGYVNRGEQPEDCLRREIREELGLRVVRWRLVHLEQAGSQLTLFYQVECSGTFRPSLEIAQVRTVPAAHLPVDLPRGQRAALARILSGGIVGEWQEAEDMARA